MNQIKIGMYTWVLQMQMTKISQMTKTEIVWQKLPNNPSDKRKNSEHVEEVTHNEPCHTFLVLGQVSIKIFLITATIVFFDDVIVIMQNICNLIGWNSVHIFDIFNYYCANINGMWNAEKLGEIYKTFEFTLT